MLPAMLFSKEKRPEFRGKRDSHEPILTAMAQVLPSPKRSLADCIRTRSTTTRDRNLQFRGAVSTGFFIWSFLQGIFVLPFLQVTVQFSKEVEPKCGENCPIFGRKKSVESCHVCGCRGFCRSRELILFHVPGAKRG